jgi:regulator of RNase E activity RraA
VSNPTVNDIDSRDELRRLRALDCCAISDAFDRLKLTGVVTGVPQAAGRSRRIVGRIITVRLGLGDPPQPVRHLGTTAIELGGPDHVIVVEQRSGIDAGSWGGLLTLGAQTKGIAGVIVDGPVRDIDEARELAFPVFTRRCTARTARGRIVELGTNVTITFEGVRVEPDDYVIADSSGIAFIPDSDIERVLSAAEEIMAREGAIARAIKSGQKMSEAMSGNYENMLKDRGNV